MAKIFATLIPITFIICATLSIYFIVRYRHETMVKLGGNIPYRPFTFKFQWKKIGIIIIGFSIGLLAVSAAFSAGLLFNSWNPFTIIGIISLCVGVAFVIADKAGNKKIDG